MSNLRGKTVLLTRSEEANVEVAALLEDRGAKTLSLPTIRFTEPDSWEACDLAIQQLGNYDAALFTSSNAVRAFLKRVEALQTNSLGLLHNIRSYAIGERTLDALNAAGIAATMAEGGTAGDLAESLGKDIHGKYFLFPKSNIARDILPEALKTRGAFVDEVIVYKTVAPAPRELDAVRNALRTGSVDVLLFFSPSAIFHFMQMIGTGHTESLVVAVIGPTTAEAARGAGFHVSVVAKKPTAGGLIESLEEFPAPTPA
ncbi:MAG: uroporphyrinogen-III synthase [Bacteroidota bacterium]